MLYYLGKGTEFKKEDCKEYKTIEGAMKAAAKDESFVVWDENGNLIGSLTDNVPEGALQTNPDGSVNTYDADGNKVGTVDAETVEKMTTFESDEDAAGQQEDAEDGGTASNDAETTNPPSEPETGENGANTEPQEAEDEPEDKVIIPQGKMKVTVICDGSLNIRRSAAWGNENICGRAIRGQSYYLKGASEPDETEEPEQPEEKTEPDAEQPDTATEPDETDEAEDEDEQEGGE